MLETVTTKYGKLKSVRSNAGYALFRGVPYAKPPVGSRRFKAPEEPDPREGVRICDTYGPACAQFDRWSVATDDINDDSGHPYILKENYQYPPKMSEDCLYLNIYTPAESEEERLPVMMYIHGGGCQQWYGSDYEYCGDHFCEKGCILVSINYRLNVFGFFAHPELDQEVEYGNSGNYGLLDQIAALRWIYENISAFGGDRDRITVFGQSSGGRSPQAVWDVSCPIVPLKRPSRWESVSWSLWDAAISRKCGNFPGKHSETPMTGWDFRVVSTSARTDMSWINRSMNAS